MGHLLKKNKVTVIMGEAKLTAPGKLSVKTEKGTDEITGKAIILATGDATAIAYGDADVRATGLTGDLAAFVADAEPGAVDAETRAEAEVAGGLLAQGERHRPVMLHRAIMGRSARAARMAS